MDGRPLTRLRPGRAFPYQKRHLNVRYSIKGRRTRPQTHSKLFEYEWRIC